MATETPTLENCIIYWASLVIWSDSRFSWAEKDFAQREKFEQKPVVTREEMKALCIAAKSGKKTAK